MSHAPAPAAATPASWAEALAYVLAQPTQPRLVFQPIVDLAHGVVVGFEALARFHGPRLAPPDVWFTQAAQAGFGAELEGRVLTAALSARRRLPRDCFLTVNLSPSLLCHPHISGLLLAASDLRRLVIELTEHVAYRADDDDLQQLMRRLRRAGAMFAIDDAGVGYSGLAQIAAVRPELVKLDRTLVDGAAGDEVKRALVALLGEYCARLDCWLLAEGVEEHDDLETLIRLGVPLAQGYLFGRPAAAFRTDLPAEVLRTLAAARLDAATRDATVDTAMALVERVPLHRLGPQEAAAVVKDGYSIVVDEHDRAQFVVQPGGLRWIPMPVTLCVSWDTAVADVARRLLLRHHSSRFDPVVCNDVAGRAIGLLRVERILEHLATPAHR